MSCIVPKVVKNALAEKGGSNLNYMMLFRSRIQAVMEFKRLFAVGVVSLAAAVSAQAQFSITLSSVQDLGGVAIDNGQPINYIYDFTISGNFPTTPGYSPYGLSVSMNGFGYPGAIDGGFTGSSVGGWLPSNPPEFTSDSILFKDYYSGGPVQGTITVVSTGSFQGDFSWGIAEVGMPSPENSSTPYTSLGSYSGLVVVPEPTNTGLLFGVALLAVASVPCFRRFKAKGN
jgi:hypothetical protein